MRLLLEGNVYFSESWTKNKNCFNYGIITIKPRFTNTLLIRTLHYYVQFALSMWKESPYNLTHLIRTLSLAPLRALLTGFDWISVLG